MLIKSGTSIYQRNGYESREHYLQSLAEDYDVPLETVHTLANLLGPEEDFDGLVSHLADMEVWG